MSDSHDQAILQPPSGGSGGHGYQSFAALRQAHLKLRESWSQGRVAPPDIRRFIAQTLQTGVALQHESDRRGAQAILDYWNAELVTAPADQLTPEDFAPAVLERFNAKQTAGMPAGPDASNETAESTRRSREVIRFVAAARLWQEHERKPGYLLYGDAITQAAKYRHLDPDIDELVAASEAKRNNRRVMVVSAAAAALIAIASMLVFESWGAGQISNSLVASVRHPDTTSSKKVFYLGLLDVLQRWQPPYDFSWAPSNLANVTTRPNLRLHAPNFSAVVFRQVSFQGAQFANATFSASVIENGNFNGANLSLAQFNGADITSSSFVGADLYRASFDRACLDEVDFSGADIPLASFWGTVFGKKGKNFANTAWWLAIGWNSNTIKDLLLQDQSKLSESAAFKKYVVRFSEPLRRTGAGTSQRAKDLNDMAWMLATWGIVGNLGNKSVTPSKKACTTAIGVPDGALEAAEQAVCIGTSLKLAYLENLNDTLAYVLMQTPGRMRDALNSYENQTLGPGSLFRAAVAQFAVGDKAKASANLKSSMQQNYVPTHELHTLKAHIRGELQTELLAYLDTVWPKPVSPACQFSSDAVSPIVPADPTEVQP